MSEDTGNTRNTVNAGIPAGKEPTMSMILKSPGKYVQGPGVLRELDRYLQGMGNHLMILQTEGGARRNREMLENCFAGKDYRIENEIFSGEATSVKCEAWAEKCRKKKVTAIIGIGGGKVLDTAKGISYLAGIPDVIIPTVCSTDAPCSSLSIMYTEDHVFDRYFFLDSCPDIVLVDTEIIAHAPVELLVAGMGDAMSTWFEARACRRSGSDNQIHAKPTISATEMAGLCWKYLRQYGPAAREAAERQEVTEALEIIVEVNTYLSSVGFESGGLAAAHGIQKGFTVIPELQRSYHGRNVAFCTIAQLVMEQAPQEELESVLDFCLSVGLPVCFADLGYSDVDPVMIRKAAEKACLPEATTHHLPFPVTSELVTQALLESDRLGREWRIKSEDN